MKISKAHKNFANLLLYWHNTSKQEVLKHPENYLGPNWEAVINFWLYLDTLTHEQLLVVRDRHLALGEGWLPIVYNEALNAAANNTKYVGDAENSAYESVSYGKDAAAYATRELIGLDKLLERGRQPVFFPMFLNP
jgi:hypothetical protein